MIYTFADVKVQRWHPNKVIVIQTDRLRNPPNLEDVLASLASRDSIAALSHDFQTLFASKNAFRVELEYGANWPHVPTKVACRSFRRSEYCWI